MKCKDCKILKFDGTQYTCPAYPFAKSIDMYAEHTSCTGMNWYPKFLRDQIETVITNIRQLEDTLADSSHFLREHQFEEGYPKLMINELKSVHEKYVNKYNSMCKESLKLQEELRRITRTDGTTV